MRVYRSAVLVAIVLLATPGACFFDASQTFGWPKSTDKNTRTHVYKNPELYKNQVYNSTIKMPTLINCIKFDDLIRSAATIWISKDPPCYETMVFITSQRHMGFSFWMTVYYE